MFKDEAMPESNLVHFFGGSSLVKIIDALMDSVGMDYSKKDIQELAGISKATLFNCWNKLEQLQLVKETRRFGKTKLYSLNKSSETVKDLFKLEMHLIEATLPKEEIKIVVRK